jgi:outer membrane murein-binding lipoprotein Lpp
LPNEHAIIYVAQSLGSIVPKQNGENMPTDTINVESLAAKVDLLEKHRHASVEWMHKLEKQALYLKMALGVTAILAGSALVAVTWASDNTHDPASGRSNNRTINGLQRKIETLESSLAKLEEDTRGQIAEIAKVAVSSGPGESQLLECQVIKTKAIIISDKGKTHGFLGIHPKEGTRLVLMHPTAENVIALSVGGPDDNLFGAGLGIKNQRGDEILSARVLNDKAWLAVKDRAADQSLSLDGSSLTLSAGAYAAMKRREEDPHEKAKRISLSVNRNEEPSVVVHGPSGKTRAVLGCTTNVVTAGKRDGVSEKTAPSSLNLYDSKGNVIWQAP